MKTLSICMIVKDEHEVLARCLSCAKRVADQLVVVDTGSTDESVKIARQFTDEVYSFDWIDDFSAARNNSFSYATCDYVMWLDADDVLPDATVDAILRFKADADEPDIVMLPYSMNFDSAGNPTCTFWRERILRRACNYRWTDPIHEVIIPTGRIVYLEGAPVEHHKVKHNPSERNLNIFRKWMRSCTNYSPRQIFYYGCELYFNGYDAQAIAMLERARNDPDTHSDNRIQACIHLSHLYERNGNLLLAERVLTDALTYGDPTCELAYRLGEVHRQCGRYRRAVMWYNCAVILNDMSAAKGVGFSRPDCGSYLAWINLAVCYYHLGDLPRAAAYNQKALDMCPDHPTALANAHYYLPKESQ